MIKGNVSPSTIKKSGKYSLRFEYDMLALDEENKAYIDLTKYNIEFKHPADAISMWVMLLVIHLEHWVWFLELKGEKMYL